MEAKKILKMTVLTLGLMVCWPGTVSAAEPISSAFTYQGHLYDDNDVANDFYDFQFKLFDDVNVADGNQVGSDVNVADIEVIDGYFTVELDFGSSVFNGDAIWLDIGIRHGDLNDPCAYTSLSPRQEVTATPYASQTRGIFVDDALNVGLGTTSPVGKLHVDGGKAMNGTWGVDLVFKAQNGGDGWAMQNDGAAGGDIILLPGEGGQEIETGSPGPNGNVGIGTITPTTKLDVGGTVTATAFVGDGSNLTGIVVESGWTISGNDMYSSLSGNVGIGTASPAYPFHVKKNIANTWIAGLHNQGTGPQDYGLVVRADGGDPLLVQTESLNALNVKQDGNIGIGTTSPGTKLHINGGNDASLGGGGFLLIGPESGMNMVLDDNEIIARNNGNPSKLYLNKDSSNVVVNVLEITGGSDLAEPFEVAGTESIKPGMVVAIDPENPGKLVVSSEAYDRKVAGIISGAGGIKPGMLMGQKGSVANGDNPVALTGRVYCLTDASKSAIKPGDMLTTSKTPGHAMKVTDYSRANGAILGKAMSSLDQGQGLVLVLVTLQ